MKMKRSISPRCVNQPISCHRPAVKGAAKIASRCADCWDKVPLENYFASLTKELVHDANFATRAEARAAVFKYIEVFYNGQSRPSALGYFSPAEYEQAQQPLTSYPLFVGNSNDLCYPHHPSPQMVPLRAGCSSAGPPSFGGPAPGPGAGKIQRKAISENGHPRSRS